MLPWIAAMKWGKQLCESTSSLDFIGANGIENWVVYNQAGRAHEKGLTHVILISKFMLWQPWIVP